MSERKKKKKEKNKNKSKKEEKCTRCDVCMHGTTDRNMEDCPIIRQISRDVTRTTYNIDGAKLNITTATYDHDFRRALNVVNSAIDSRCR